jgi:hypothetical protein
MIVGIALKPVAQPPATNTQRVAQPSPKSEPNRKLALSEIEELLKGSVSPSRGSVDESRATRKLSADTYGLDRHGHRNVSSVPIRCRSWTQRWGHVWCFVSSMKARTFVTHSSALATATW